MTSSPEDLINVTFNSSVDFMTESFNVSEAKRTACDNVTEEWCPEDMEDMWFRHDLGMTVVCCLAYFAVFSLGIIGNGFVVIVVLRSPRMRTVTNFFIVNLAVADILVLVFCLPATLLSNILIPWLLGWFMCKAVAYVQGLSVIASIYSLVALSFDRFLAICYPLRCQITRTRAKIVIVILWIAAIIIPVPWAMYFDVEPFSEFSDHVFCQEKWPSIEAEKLYFLIANLLLIYVIPLLVISYCYIMIWLKVWSRIIPGESKGSHMDNLIQKSKVKVVKMLIVVVILFMLSWLPLFLIFARIKLGGDVTSSVEMYLISIVTPLAQWLGSANSCVNPVLYTFFNEKFRNGFVAVMKDRRCCGNISSQYDDYFRSTVRHASSIVDPGKGRNWRRKHVIENDISVVNLTTTTI